MPTWQPDTGDSRSATALGEWDGGGEGVAFVSEVAARRNLDGEGEGAGE